MSLSSLWFRFLRTAKHAKVTATTESRATPPTIPAITGTKLVPFFELAVPTGVGEGLSAAAGVVEGDTEVLAEGILDIEAKLDTEGDGEASAEGELDAIPEGEGLTEGEGV